MFPCIKAGERKGPPSMEDGIQGARQIGQEIGSDRVKSYREYNIVQSLWQLLATLE